MKSNKKMKTKTLFFKKKTIISENNESKNKWRKKIEVTQRNEKKKTILLGRKIEIRIK